MTVAVGGTLSSKSTNQALHVLLNIEYLSRLVGKPTMWFPNRSGTNRPVQAQKQARSLKFRIKEEEEVYYPCSENKGADQLKRLPRR